MLLGSNEPFALRESSTGQYQVVGECFVHGLHDSMSLLGMLPEPWKVSINWDSDGLARYSFVNSLTGEATTDDPRLGELPKEWVRVENDLGRTPDDPEIYERFQNLVTGEILDSDPRMSPELLQQRGVKLRSFQQI